MVSAPTVSQSAAMIGLPINANDEAANSTGESTTSSGTYQDKLTLSFTPDSSGDYLIIAYAQLDNDTNVRNSLVRLYDNENSKAYAQTSIRAKAAGNDEWYPWATMFKLTLSGSQDFRIQFRRLFPGTTAKIRYAHLIAIRLDNYRINYFGTSAAASTTTSSTFQNKLTVTRTGSGAGALEAANHLILATCSHAISSTSDSCEVELLGADDKRLIYSNVEPYGIFTQDQTCFFGCFVRGESTVTNTYKLNFRSIGGGTAAIYDAVIAVIQVDAAPTVKILGKTLVKGETLIK